MCCPKRANRGGVQLDLAEVTTYWKTGGNLAALRDLGRTVRGGFGLALRELSCVEPDQQCRGCVHATRCAYGYLFETPLPPNSQFMRKYTNAPHPFVLRAQQSSSRDGTVLRIHLCLVGRAIEYYPRALLALVRLGKLGLGPGRVPLSLAKVRDEAARTDQEADPNGAVVVMPQRVAVPIKRGPSSTRDLRVTLHTPLRLVSDGGVTRKLTYGRLVSASLRRIELLWRVHCASDEEAWELDAPDLVSRAEAVPCVLDSTRWVEGERYSRRQDRSHPMGGLLGRLRFGASGGPLAPLLALGGRLHLGKHTAFGHGHLTVDWEDDHRA
jgi:hypothetical protein